MSFLFAKSLMSVRSRRSIRDAFAFCMLLCLCTARPCAPQEASKGLSKDQVIRLLREDPVPRVQYLVNKYGIAFYLSPETETDLKNAGATPELVDLIRKLAPQKPAEPKPPPPPPSPTLVIHAKPGEAEVYVDDERRGQTGSDGTLKLGDLTPGTHRLRISLPGYHSFEVAVDLAAGEANTVMAELQPNPPPVPAKDQAPAKEAATAAITKTHGDPNDPLTPHAPGIYYIGQADKTPRLFELEEAPPASRAPQISGRSAALAGLAPFSGLGGPRWKTLIYGGKAHLRVPPGRPVFYFYFPNAENDASTYGLPNDAFRHTSTPGGFVLVHLQVRKNAAREIPAKGGVTATVEEKDTVPFNFEILAPGIYKVQLKDEIGPGEYGYLYGGVLQVTAQTWLFDFGIDKTK